MNKPRTFRKRPVEIQAVQFDGTNHADIEAFAAGCFTIDVRTTAHKPGIVAEVWDKLHHTWVGVKAGDWIVRGIAGEFYPVDAAVMEQTYEDADTTAVRDYTWGQSLGMDLAGRLIDIPFNDGDNWAGNLLIGLDDAAILHDMLGDTLAEVGKVAGDV